MGSLKIIQENSEPDPHVNNKKSELKSELSTDTLKLGRDLTFSQLLRGEEKQTIFSKERRH